MSVMQLLHLSYADSIMCAQKCASIATGMLFGWEIIMTFVLVSVVYAVAIGEPSFGVVGPFAVGLSLFAMVFAGKAASSM